MVVKKLRCKSGYDLRNMAAAVVKSRVKMDKLSNAGEEEEVQSESTLNADEEKRSKEEKT